MSVYFKDSEGHVQFQQLQSNPFSTRRLSECTYRLWNYVFAMHVFPNEVQHSRGSGPIGITM